MIVAPLRLVPGSNLESWAPNPEEPCPSENLLRPKLLTLIKFPEWSGLVGAALRLHVRLQELSLMDAAFRLLRESQRAGGDAHA